MINGIKSIGKEPVREWIFHEKVRNREQVWIARILRAVALEGAEIVRIPQLRAQLFENRPISLLPRPTDFLLKVMLEVGCNPIIVEQRVVHIKQKNHTLGHGEILLQCDL